MAALRTADVVHVLPKGSAQGKKPTGQAVIPVANGEGETLMVPMMTPATHSPQDTVIIPANRRHDASGTHGVEVLRHTVSPGKSVVEPVLEVQPKRRHASSGFAYPKLLQDYGVSVADWKAFTKQFQTSNSLRKRDWLLLPVPAVLNGVGGVAFPIAVILMTGAFPPVGFLGVLIGVALGAATAVPNYFWRKRKSLRRADMDGTLGNWIAAWNAAYFEPKGLTVGFELPEKYIPDKSPRGVLKLMERPPRMPLQARIVIAPIHDPVPSAGQRPTVPLTCANGHHKRKAAH